MEKASGGNDKRPIASISKLITALVVLDAHPLASADDRGPTVTFSEADADLYDKYYVQGATIATMPAGTTMSLHDALATMLLPSASNYAEALARWAYGSTGAFVSATRSWLAKNGLNDTTIVEPTGLDARNTSTPSDLVALGKIAAANPALAAIAATRSLSLNGPGDITNTNDLLGTLGIDGLKTGNLGEGTFNLLFTSALNVTGVPPLRVVGVVLGGQSHESTDSDVTTMLQSIRDGFHQVPVSTRGQKIGTITTPWGASASVVVVRDASILTWSDTPIAVTLDTAAASSYTDGQVIGHATWTAGTQSATVDITISGSIEQPTLLWRLTHPTALG
jgi:serine-type D-Ala-D-Ala carboxypeptidase (penicillin-binding protein 5/6)